MQNKAAAQGVGAWRSLAGRLAWQAGSHLQLVARKRRQTPGFMAPPQQPRHTPCGAPPLQARKTFQKLIYVSNLVFGERQQFLLPWSRVFGLTDAQLYVAKRDNAKGIFKQYLDSQGGQLQVGGG